MIEDDILTASWNSPFDPNGIVDYEINITFCDLATGAMSLLGELIQRNDTNRFVQFINREEPFVRYDVYLLAYTTGGMSEVVSANVSSNQGGEKQFSYSMNVLEGASMEFKCITT